jgi:pre-mRNA-splicing factor 38B
MSRSALQKEFLKKQQQMLQPVPPPQYLQMQAQQQQYYMQYQAQQAAMMGMPVMTGVDPMQPAFVPIPLTGDDDDNEGPAAKSNVLPMYGNNSNYNINNLLYNNIMENEYFRALYQLRTYHEVIDEIYRSVDHVEPWQTGTSRFPSSAFCLLVKFMLMKLTLKQMKGLLGTSDCANVRAIGLLYLRYTCPPAELYKWYEPYLEDTEEFAPGADKSVKTTIGEYCVKLLTDMQYFGTTLSRIPVPIERKIKVFLLLLEEKKKRRRANMRDKERGLYCVGAKVRAIYSDDTNEPAWYEAVIDSIDEESPDGTKFWVTFPEYGNSEKVDLGDMELLPAPGAVSEARRDATAGGEARRSSASRSRSRDRGGDRDRSRRDSRDRDRDRAGGGRDRRDSRDRGSRRDDDRREDSRDRRRDRHERDDSRDRGRDRDSGRRRDASGSRDRDDRGSLVGAGGSTSNLLEQVLQSQREASAAVGKNYGQRPASYKGSLSLKQDRYTARRKSPSPDRRRRRSRSRSPQTSSRPSGSSGAAGMSGSHSSSSNLLHGAGGGGGGAGGAEQADRMRMLKARYGDASATTK